jgi:hypothetical protein
MSDSLFVLLSFLRDSVVVERTWRKDFNLPSWLSVSKYVMMKLKMIDDEHSKGIYLYHGWWKGLDDCGQDDYS